MEVLLTTAAFDVTTADVQPGAGARAQSSPAPQPIVRRLLRRQERVVAVDRGGIEEDAAGRDLRDRAHVREHQLRVDVGKLSQLVVTHRAQAVTRVGTQVVVERAEVVLIGGVARTDGTFAARRVDRVAEAALSSVQEIRERAREGRAGTAASERHGRVRAQRAGREVAVALQDLLVVLIGSVGRDVAAAVFGADAHGERALHAVAVGHVVIGQRELRRIRRGATGDHVTQLHCARAAEVVVVLIEAVLAVDLHAFEVFLHDEVDDAGDGVRSVHGGRAAGQHFDALDHRGRNLVQVGAAECGDAAVRHAPAVDEHQRAGRAEAAQVDRRGARGAVGDRARSARRRPAAAG